MVSKSLVDSPNRWSNCWPAADWSEANLMRAFGSRSITKLTAALHRLQTPSNSRMDSASALPVAGVSGSATVNIVSRADRPKVDLLAGFQPIGKGFVGG